VEWMCAILRSLFRFGKYADALLAKLISNTLYTNEGPVMVVF